MTVSWDSTGGGTTGTTGSTTYSWSHTTVATSTVVSAAVAVDASPDSMTVTCKLDGTLMTQQKVIHSDNGTAGYLAVFTAAASSSGAHTLLATASSAPGDMCGGSLAFAGGSGSVNVWPTTPASGNGWGVGTAPSAVTSAATTTGGMVAAFCTNGSGGIASAGTATSRFTDNYIGTSSFASGNCGGETVASSGSAMTITFTCFSDWWAEVLIEVLPPTSTSHPGTASLTGAGTLTGAGVFAGNEALSGSGSITATGTHTSGSRGVGTASLSGIGSLAPAIPTGTFAQYGALSGSGTLSTAWTEIFQPPSTALSGIGTLGVSGEIQQYPAALAGQGTLSVLQATGGLVFTSAGATISQAYPGASQVAVAPPGSSNWQFLGTLGHISALTYSFICPGGADRMNCTLMVPANYRNQYLNPGWQVRITRGGHTAWSGKLDEPSPSSAGWTVTATGTGNLGQDYVAFYANTWPTGQPDETVNRAITRGLPWVNPGVGTPSGAWFGQAVDPAAQTVTSLLNLVCTRGGLTWYVNSQPGGLPGNDLSVFPLPTTPNRLLSCTTPVARTLGGDINTIFIRYQVTADTISSSGNSIPATFAMTTVQNTASVTAHGVIETFIDLSDVGIQTSGQAQAVGNNVLKIYQRASFAGPFTGRYGQLMNPGGTPIDPGTDQAATMVRLILTDYGYGGEVTPQFPIQFIVGAYEWDDITGVFTITPYQTVNQSLTGLLSLANTELVPITVA